MAIKFITKKVAASNKTQTLPENPTEAIDSLPQSPTPFIDKISIVVPFAKEDGATLFNGIWMYVDDKEFWSDAGSKAKGSYKFAKLINLTKSVHRPLFQFQHENKIALKFRIEFNPRKLGADGLSELKAAMVCIVPDGWEYVIKHGRVTRLDVAVDILNARPDDFKLLPQQGLTHQKWAMNGKSQTFTLGLPKGNQTSIYNVKAKRLKQGKSWGGKAAVRIERKLRKPSPSKLPLLDQLNNPFLSLKLIRMPGPPANSKKWMWTLFCDSVSVRGLSAALALIPPERRTEYRKHLAQFEHEKWVPELIWAKWPQYIAGCQLGVM